MIVFGESIGGAVALSLWTRSSTSSRKPAALILSSTFASMSDVVAWHYPWFPFQYLLLDRWPSIERIPHFRSPITVFHGKEDRMIPLAQARKLANASGATAKLIEIDGADHNALPRAQLRTELENHFEAIANAAR